MKKILILLTIILLYSCATSTTETDKQPYIHTVTHPYQIELFSGVTFTKNICTRTNDNGEDYLDLCQGRLYNYWSNEIAREVKSFQRILTNDTIVIDNLRTHMLSIDGIIVDLPEEWMNISNNKWRKESLKGYISNDTLYIEFNH